MAALALGLAVAGCAQPATTTPDPARTTGTASTPPATVQPGGTCAALADQLTPREQAGQLVMAGVTGELDAAEKRAIEASGLGSVILMGNSTEGAQAIRARTERIAALAGPAGMLVAVDQEGGPVQRFKGPGFETIPPAVRQADLEIAELRAAAARWGRQLADAGVHLNMAPVADVVPADRLRTNEPIGKLGRGYGTTPRAVAPRVGAFVAGMREAGVATSPKHFPNLGRVTGNTDLVARVDDRETTADDPALAPYRAAIEAGAQTVMVGSAYYTRIDPDAPAAFSPAVIGILRDGLGFDGVVISDDLGVASSARIVPLAERAARFVRAGGDLVISVEADAASAMADGLAAAAQADPALAAQVRASAGRVLALKGAVGAASCQAG